ncbi:MAG: GNAT family N-acetyltransferase [Mycobacteriaceae bacterium]|nr:GNAT family N-acetyltransferase [Mycobacteriaceae bacterium]MBV9641134.1 GNAT family N-acetyltransferase [Mycobacteriaceae bacterium]
MPQDGGVPDDEVLVGPRILLRRPRLTDADALFARVASDPQVTQYLSWTPHSDVGETRRVISELFNIGDDHTWVIAIRDTGDVVGQLGYRRPQPHAAELGYCLARQWWGQGLMSEAVRVVLDALARDPALFRVSAACHVCNTRSARLLERAGLSPEGRLTRYVVLPNLSPEPQDVVLYAKAMR